MSAVTLLFDNVTFEYRKRSVYQRLQLQVPSGATLLLGPNGAGKSTLFKLAVGLLSPTAGKIVRTCSCGYMPQNVAPMRGLTVREQIEYAGWLSGLSQTVARARTPAILHAVDLETHAAASTSSLSGGQLRRVGIAEAMIGGEDLILLDEPSAGLDPEQRVHLRTVLLRLREMGTSLFVSTHQTDDLSEVFDHVIIIDSGRVCFSDSIHAFLRHAPANSRRPTEDAYLAVIRAGR